MNICEYQGCDSPAEYIDNMDNKVCGDCMEREIEDDKECYPEDFEALKNGEIDTGDQCQ